MDQIISSIQTTSVDIDPEPAVIDVDDMPPAPPSVIDTDIPNTMSPVTNNTDVEPEVPIVPEGVDPVLPERRSGRIRKCPDRYKEFIT